MISSGENKYSYDPEKMATQEFGLTAEERLVMIREQRQQKVDSVTNSEIHIDNNRDNGAEDDLPTEQRESRIEP